MDIILAIIVKAVVLFGLAVLLVLANDWVWRKCRYWKYRRDMRRRIKGGEFD